MPRKISNHAVIAIAASVVASFLVCPRAFAQGSPDLVISQVYGGGGNAGATYKNDFVEIFNRGTAPASLLGMSLQYASATGTGNLGITNPSQITILPAVTLNPGQYYLVQEAGGANGSPLPVTADLIVTTNAINMSGSAGKVALVNSTTSLGCNGGSTPCSPAALALIVDLLGYGNANFFEGSGAAPTLTATTAAIRRGAGRIDTDNNAADFTAATPAPRNSAPSLAASGSATPSSVPAGDATTLTVTVTPGANPTSTGIAVSGDLSSIGGSTVQPFADGGGGTFSYLATVSLGTATGAKSIPVVVSDAQNRSASASIALTVTAPVPAVAIHDIQGPTNFAVTWGGQVVQTEGVVTAVKSNGFFIQAPDNEVDGDANTSEGIFVFTSSAPPAGAAVGNRVKVRGRVQDFIPASDPLSPPVTEIANSPAVTLLSTGNPLPAPITIGAADLDPTGTVAQLFKYEGMRVHVDTLVAVSPTGGTIKEASATSTSNGSFWGVLPGVPRPFREQGIEAPAVAPPGVPQFDANPERLRVDTRGQVGATAINLSTGAVVSNLTGVLDFAQRTYTLDPDSGTPPTVTNNDAHAVPVRAGSGEGELTVASFNMERFFDTVDDPATSDPVLTADAFDRRLAKASLAIRDVLQMPDVIGVEEMENIGALQALTARIDADAAAAGQTPPAYLAYLFEGNDIGGIDVGLLVKSGRIEVVDMQQIGKDTTFVQPDGATALLNDRPPLLMKANVKPQGKELPFAVTVIVNHLRSLSGIEGSGGARIRAKRLAQAEFLADLINHHQGGLLDEKVISVGDYNAFDVNDGYVDVINTVRGGTPHPFEDVLGEPARLVDTPLIDLAPADPAQHYSYVFSGNAQVLDHIIVSQGLTVNDFTYARNDADFPESLRNDATRPERISDHDMPVAYFAVPRDTVPPTVLLIGVSEGAFYRLGAVPAATCTTTDDAAGVQTPATLQITGGNSHGEGAFTASCTGAVDNVGNVAAAVSVHYTVDGTPPTVTLTGVAEGATYLLGTVPAAGCTTTDDAAGVKTFAALRITGGDANGVGAIIATCTGAVDNVGNVAADVSVHYLVVAYVFGGFEPPLSKDKTVKSGSTVPVKFQVFDWNDNLISSTSVIAGIEFAPNASCNGTPAAGWQAASSSGGTGLSFEGNRFHFNWKTTGLSAGCYSIGVKTVDTLTHAATVFIR